MQQSPTQHVESDKLSYSLQELIEQQNPPLKKRSEARAIHTIRGSPSGRRVIHSPEEARNRPRRLGLGLQQGRSLDVAVRGICGKRRDARSLKTQATEDVVAAHSAQTHSQLKNSLTNTGAPFPVVAIPPGYIVAPIASYQHLKTQKSQRRLNPGEAALLSTNVIQREDGDIVVIFKQTEIISIKKDTGDMILTSGGYRTFSTRSVMNQALQPVGLKVEEVQKQQGQEGEAESPPPISPPAVEWVVTDGRSYLQSFHDGLVIRQIGSLTKQQLLARGSVILQFLRQKKTNVEKRYRLSKGLLHHAANGNNPRRPQAQQQILIDEHRGGETMD